MNRKEFVLNAVSRKQDLVVEVSDRIFDFAETGFHEFETAKLYQQVLEKEGFAVEMGIAGMPTAFKATYGNGKPVVEKRMGIGIYGPALNEKGNSIGGSHVLEYLSKELNLHMFAAEQ